MRSEPRALAAASNALAAGTGTGMRVDEAGFSLIEVLIAAALFALLALGAFEVLRVLAGGAQGLASRRLAYASLEGLTARMRAEARSATAIWTSSSTGGGACLQIDFFGDDSTGPAFWSYRSRALRAPDATPDIVLERLAGTAPIPACDASRRGTIVLDGLRAAPVATTIEPAALAAHADSYLGTSDAGFVADGVPAIAPVALGVLDAAGNPVRGGNAIVELRLDTAAGSRVIDLLPGVFPNGFTEVLRYACSERCEVGHDTAAPKTLTSCALTWQPGWSEFVRWNDFVTNPDGTLTFPGGWFIAGTFAFTYSGTRASDGGTDTLVRPYVGTNWDAARDYAAYPPDRAAADGSSAGSFAPWDVPNAPPRAWLAQFAPYLAAGSYAPIAAEQRRCDAVEQQGANGGFYANG